MAILEMSEVSKEYRIHKRKTGLYASLRSLIWREHEIRHALQDVSFQVERGEMVGYIGPNGAGKSTTIKILCGILVPSSGTIRVDGRIPYRQRQQNAQHISVVFGQRSQLFWDLPVIESFDVFGKMYGVEKARLKDNIAFFVDLLDLGETLQQPARQLSLGQKMRANLALAFLHDPEIIYLDEPTIGLDIMAKKKMRHFLKEINRTRGTTVFMTTHDMDDIEQVCGHILMLDQGKLLYDGPLREFKDKFSSGHRIMVDFEEDGVVFADPRFQVVREEGSRKWLAFRAESLRVADAAAFIIGNYSVRDLSITEPGIEEIILDFYERPKERAERES